MITFSAIVIGISVIAIVTLIVDGVCDIFPDDPVDVAKDLRDEEDYLND